MNILVSLLIRILSSDKMIDFIVRLLERLADKPDNRINHADAKAIQARKSDPFQDFEDE